MSPRGASEPAYLTHVPTLSNRQGCSLRTQARPLDRGTPSSTAIALVFAPLLSTTASRSGSLQPPRLEGGCSNLTAEGHSLSRDCARSTSGDNAAARQLRTSRTISNNDWISEHTRWGIVSCCMSPPTGVTIRPVTHQRPLAACLMCGRRLAAGPYLTHYRKVWICNALESRYKIQNKSLGQKP